MPARTFVPFDRRSLINFQQRSMCWVPHFTFTVFPPGNLWTFILTKFGLVHSHFPFFLTRFFWWTTESWRTPGSFILYALAESVWKITERLANHFLPKGPQSCFVMGPGPGDRVAVNVGLSRASTSVWGFPLWTNSHHCSQSMERSAFTSCSQAASDKTSLLSKVASSPSTSDHFPEAPNLMPFSFCTTYFFRTSCRFLCMASTTLWFTPKMRWMEASGTRRITRSNKADWVWSDKASGPLPAWKSGCKYWGWILCWQALLLHRYFGLASLQWVCNVDKVPRLHLGQRLPDQSGKILSWISIFTMSMSEAFRSSGTTRRQWVCSLRTPRAGTARFPLTYGTCFQDCVFKLAGRLITMRPLPFFGPGKFMNLDTMTECATASNDAEQELSNYLRALWAMSCQWMQNHKLCMAKPRWNCKHTRTCTGTSEKPQAQTWWPWKPFCPCNRKAPSLLTDMRTLSRAVDKTAPQCEDVKLCLETV